MVDVTIRGAGIFGLSIAWACTERGARVQLVDPAGPGAGASGGLVGALAPHVPENWNDKKAFQFDSLLAARRFWPEVEAAGGVSAGFRATGRVQPIADAGALALARARCDSAATLWQGKAEWRVIEASSMAPWAPPSPTGLVIHDTLSAHLHPRRACAALVVALRARAVEVVPDAPARGAVIWATGVAGLIALGADAGRDVGGAVKGQAALLVPRRPPPPDAPQIFADALHIIPHADGTVAVGSTSERDHEGPTTTDASLDRLIDRARAQVPWLREARVVERWAGLRPRAKSRAPMLGAWPGKGGHFIANGGFKIGFGMAPEVARVIADLVLEGADAIPDGFRVAASL